MKKSLKLTLGLTSLLISSFCFGQTTTYRPQGVNISMGLIPVYELSLRGGCPYLLAAPAPQYYNLSYRECSSDKFTEIKSLQDQININAFMLKICAQAAQVGCQAELLVVDPNDYSNNYQDHQDQE